MSEFEWGWAIGMFEGEGTIHLQKPNSNVGHTLPHGQWILQVQMTDEDVVRRFHTIVGVGHVTGPYQPQRRTPGHPYKVVWQWKCGRNEDTLALLYIMLPALGDRRQVKALECLTDMVV